MPRVESEEGQRSQRLHARQPAPEVVTTRQTAGMTTMRPTPTPLTTALTSPRRRPRSSSNYNSNGTNLERVTGWADVSKVEQGAGHKYVVDLNTTACLDWAEWRRMCEDNPQDDDAQPLVCDFALDLQTPLRSPDNPASLLASVRQQRRASHSEGTPLLSPGASAGGERAWNSEENNGGDLSWRRDIVYPFSLSQCSAQKEGNVVRHVPTIYGSMSIHENKRGMSTQPEQDADTTHAANNQSETESDSDGSCGNAQLHGLRAPALQSILRIRSTDSDRPRTLLKKASSVEFAIDVDDTDDEADGDDDAKKGRKDTETCFTSTRRKSCSAKCLPRRLTIEEKAALYRIRPDLEHTPTPVLLLELEETRRRRQRRVVFSLMGSVLVIFILVVLYYISTQV
ncbi:hypothetical protein P43SY_001285 [Pythium insidiosum]|uniref:Transmembrane protein n=1 Tax=Pythium insidiosum TaxID=114742 RepID=A0AAD5LHV6_PYTIN|nr:hypothetical protein P43SY_001285 [Pythium insidiosum]